MIGADKMKKWIGLLLLFVGLGLLLMPHVKHEKQKEEMDEIEHALSQLESNDKTVSNKVSKEMKKELSGALRLKLPAIKLSEVVLKETNQDTLNKALTQVKSKQSPGKGNFVVAGHRSLVYGRHFNRLDELKKGDPIYLENKTHVYEYNVVRKVTVLPNEVDVLLDVKGQKTISLITCTPMETATHRLIVIGELKRVIKKNEVKDGDIKKRL